MPIKLPSFRPRKDAYPPDLWTKCPSCSEMLFNKQLDKADRVCPTCGHHFRLSARARAAVHPRRRAASRSSTPGSRAWTRWGSWTRSRTRTGSRPRRWRPACATRRSGVSGRSTAGACPICVMDFGFMGGSMGAVVGEKVTRAAEAALAERIPLIVVSASGGARMQEGTLALMQLAKTCAALERLRAGGVPYISVMSDPTTGGVFASYAVLGDVNLAEPNALIGFAGARVTAGTIAQELPPGFQRAEFLFEHGFLDRVVHRRELRHELVAPAPLPRPGQRDRQRRGRREGARPSIRSGSSPRSGIASRPMVDRLLGRTREAAAGAPRRCEGRRLEPRPACPQPAPAADARAPRRDGRRARRASRRPGVRRRRRDRRPGSPGSKAVGSPSSGSRRAPTRRRTSGATSGCRTPRATGRRCG